MIEKGSVGVWFLPKGASYDVARVYSPTGIFRGYYVDALEPVDWEGDDPESLNGLTDLFLDLWIWPDGRHIVLDDEELTSAETKGIITPSQASCARRTITDLVDMLRRGEFPRETVSSFQLTADLIDSLTQV